MKSKIYDDAAYDAKTKSYAYIERHKLSENILLVTFIIG